MSTACALQYDELQMLESLTNDFHTRDQALLALIASSWNLPSARILLRYKLNVAVPVNEHLNQKKSSDASSEQRLPERPP